MYSLAGSSDAAYSYRSVYRNNFLPAGRGASAGTRLLAMAVCPCLCLSVCLSQVGSYIETVERIELVRAWKLPSTHPTLC